MLPLLARATSAFIFISALGFAADQPPMAALPEDAAADSSLSGPLLSLEECVASALAKNYAVRIQSSTTALTQEDVVIAQSAYDPVFGVTWQTTYHRDPLQSLDTNSRAKAENSQTGVSVDQPLRTGGTLSANYNLTRGWNDQLSFNNPPFNFNPAYNGTASLSLAQPLLQGFGLDYSRANIEIANLQANVSRLDFKTSVLTAVLGVETDYYTLIYTHRQYAVGLDSLNLAQKLLDENTNKLRVGVVSDLDVAQAQVGVATARSKLILYKQAIGNASDILLQAMGERAFKSPVGRVDFPPLPDTGVSFDVSYKLARDNTPELNALQMDTQISRLQALQAKRDSLPKLDAQLGGDYLGTDSSYSLANSAVWRARGYDWNAGLVLSIPWGMQRNRALHRQAMETVVRREAQYDQFDQNLTVQVRAAVRAVQANVEGVAASAQATFFSQRQYDLQKRKFDAGLSTSYDVLVAQNLLETARQTEIQSQVNLRIALATLHSYEGTSLAQYRIDLK